MMGLVSEFQIYVFEELALVNADDVELLVVVPDLAEELERPCLAHLPIDQ